jgi:hypothetical protein
MFKTNVEQIEGNERALLIFVSLWRLSPRKFPKRFLCVHKVKKVFENLPN